jgi:colicin import membrane protein
MRLNARFWRNVTLIALIHLVALITLLRWAGASKIASAQEITWLTDVGEASATADTPTIEETPTPEPERRPSAPEEDRPGPAPAKSEIEIPAATPLPTPSPSAVPKPSPKPSPKSSPKKKASSKPSATPKKKKSHPAATPTKEKENAKKLAAKKGEPNKSESKLGAKIAKSANGASGGQTGASAGPANASWYGNMLHDRFYREWAQPTTVVASGAKLSALAKVRIEKDGRISDFKIVRSSGNVVVDESVEAVGRKVTRVDALPAGIGNGGHYDVNVNFALNSK